MNKLILTIALLNSILLLTLLFWAINKNCSRCQQEMKLNRIFTLQDKCQDCEGRHHA